MTPAVMRTVLSGTGVGLGVCDEAGGAVGSSVPHDRGEKAPVKNFGLLFCSK